MWRERARLLTIDAQPRDVEEALACAAMLFVGMSKARDMLRCTVSSSFNEIVHTARDFFKLSRPELYFDQLEINVPRLAGTPCFYCVFCELNRDIRHWCDTALRIRRNLETASSRSSHAPTSRRREIAIVLLFLELWKRELDTLLYTTLLIRYLFAEDYCQHSITWSMEGLLSLRYVAACYFDAILSTVELPESLKFLEFWTEGDAGDNHTIWNETSLSGSFHCRRMGGLLQNCSARSERRVLHRKRSWRHCGLGAYDIEEQHAAVDTAQCLCG